MARNGDSMARNTMVMLHPESWLSPFSWYRYLGAQQCHTAAGNNASSTAADVRVMHLPTRLFLFHFDFVAAPTLIHCNAAASLALRSCSFSLS